MKTKVVTALILFISYLGYAQTYESGVSYQGTNGYVTYHAGNLPLIISVSHGGALTPSSIPDRSCGGCVTVTDSYTQQLGETLLDRINDYTGCDLHVVINELKRTKLDANRDIGEAALGNAEAELAWTEYHAFLDSAKAEVMRNWGRGLVIDLHGHGHDIQRLELGYLVSGADLRTSDSELDMKDLEDLPIRALVNATDLTISAALRGEESLGTIFSESGYDAVPSMDITEPESGEPYFSGGYITRRHGSMAAGSIDAIQVECNQDVRFTTSERDRFADSLAVVLLDYLDVHYHMNLRSGACMPTRLVDPSDIQEISVFPNPVCGELTISIDTEIDKATLFNNIGQVVHQSEGIKLIELDHLLKGVYYLRVESGDQVYRQRVIVQCN